MTKPSTVTHSQIITQLIAQLNKQLGWTALARLTDLPKRQHISTGITHLDGLLNGGYPAGCVLEIFGQKQSGKTSLALSIAGQRDSVLYIDGERKITPEWAQKFGAHGDYVIAQPTCLEEALELTKIFLQAGTNLVVIDSLPSLPSRKEVEEKNFDKNTGMAHTAGLLARKLGVLNNLCHEMGGNLLVVNQLRANTNAMPFGEQYHTFGGLMLPSIASVRISVARKSWLKHEKLGVFGHELVYLVDKSSVSAPRQGGDIPLVFAQGFVPADQLPAVRSQLLLSQKAGTYDKVVVQAEYTVEEIESELEDGDVTT